MAERTQFVQSPKGRINRKQQQQQQLQQQQAAMDEQAMKQEKARGPRYEGQFFKTKMCMFWAKGMCTRGLDCKYAHGDTELNAMPNLTRTSLCKDLLTTGQCTRQECPFAHSVEDLRATQKFYRTSMCSFYRVGQCRLGDECRHAHHVTELREIPAGVDGQSAATTDDVEDPRGRRTGPSGKPGRRAVARALPQHGYRAGGEVSSSSKRWKDIEDEDDDELGELPQWERTTTSPATFGNQMPSLMNYTIRGGSGMAAGSRDFGSCTTGTSWTTENSRASCSSEEEEDFGEDLPDMWARMRTMPAPCMAAPALLQGGAALPLMPQAAAAALPTQGYRKTGDPTKPVMMVPCMLVPVPVSRAQQPQQPGVDGGGGRGRRTLVAPGPMPQGVGTAGVDGFGSNQGASLQPLPTPLPLETGGPFSPGCVGNVGNVAVGNTYGAGAMPLDLETTKALCNQLEAKILENAMPEVYED